MGTYPELFHVVYTLSDRVIELQLLNEKIVDVISLYLKGPAGRGQIKYASRYRKAKTGPTILYDYTLVIGNHFK